MEVLAVANNRSGEEVVIIGGGIAALSAAEEIRKHTPNIKVTMISKENHLPYYRLNLSRYMAGEVGKKNLTVKPETWFGKNDITYLVGNVESINTETKTIELDNGEIKAYDKLIIATGAYPFVPPIEGNKLKNVFTVRTIEDVDNILEVLKNVDKCVCIGGGILGLEIAGAIAKTGVKVTVLEGADWLMPRQLNKKGAEVLKSFLSKLGIEAIEKANIKEIIGTESCEGVRLQSGEVFETKLVTVTTGVRPEISLAQNAGLETGRGLVVNDMMQTSDESIFAAGDVAEHKGIVYGIWNAAQQQGKVAGLNAAGVDSSFGGIPASNVLKVLGLDMFSIGQVNPFEEGYVEFDKETDDGYCLFVLREGKILGGLTIGFKEISLKLKQAIEKSIDFSDSVYNNADAIIEKLKSM
jgi:nitrite reductase (NADH) large subunit